MPCATCRASSATASRTWWSSWTTCSGVRARLTSQTPAILSGGGKLSGRGFRGLRLAGLQAGHGRLGSMASLGTEIRVPGHGHGAGGKAHSYIQMLESAAEACQQWLVMRSQNV